MTLRDPPKYAKHNYGYNATQEEIDAWVAMAEITKPLYREKRIDRQTVVGMSFDMTDSKKALKICFKASDGTVVEAFADLYSYGQEVRFIVPAKDGPPLVDTWNSDLTAMQLLEMSAGLDPLEIWYNAVRNRRTPSEDTAKEAP